MANPFFRCKQFTVYHHRCAMKVCTDACLFGAWVAQQAAYHRPKNMLDVGTGTALLSLMVAQKTTGHLHAIDTNGQACQQAADNVAQSPFAGRITTVQADVKHFAPAITFGLVFSNPPFYEQQLKSPDPLKNIAHHSEALTLAQLFAAADRLVHPHTGAFALLLPYHRAGESHQIAQQNGLFVHRQLNVRASEKHAFFRAMIWYSRQQQPVEQTQMSIVESGVYSPAFKSLLADYYLAL